MSDTVSSLQVTKSGGADSLRGLPTVVASADVLSHFPPLQSVPVLFMTSAVYVISASVECDKWNDCGGERGYAVSVGVISTLICLVVLVLQRMGKGAAVSPYGEIIAGFLMFWWLVGACYGTL
jgi:hypothetical protein